MELDRTNKRILALLEANARISAAEIGRTIALSRPAVQDRITAMERAGVIRGYHTQIAPEAELVQAVLVVQIAERPCARALSWLRGLEGVRAVASLAGKIDALVEVALPSMADLSALNDKVAQSELIAAARSHVILRRI